MRVVGYLLEGDYQLRNVPLRLRELGYVEGRNLRFETRRVPEFATGAQLERAAAELANSGAEVIVASGADHVLALRRATSTIPIVSGGVSNPVSLGIARSLRAPGMNVTGLSFGLEEAAALQLGTFRLLLPRLKRVVFLVRADVPDPRVFPEHRSAADALGLTVDLVLVKDIDAVERALAVLRDSAAEAVWVADVLPPPGMKQVAAAAIRGRLVTHGKEVARDGLLFSYWLTQSDSPLRVAVIVDKILRGADPAKIPFELPDKTDFILNQATAAAIGVRIPDELRLRATEIVG